MQKADHIRGGFSVSFLTLTRGCRFSVHRLSLIPLCLRVDANKRNKMGKWAKCSIFGSRLERLYVVYERWQENVV